MIGTREIRWAIIFVVAALGTYELFASSHAATGLILIVVAACWFVVADLLKVDRTSR